MDIKMKTIHADLHIVMFTLSLPPPYLVHLFHLEKQPVFHKHHLMRKCVCVYVTKLIEVWGDHVWGVYVKWHLQWTCEFSSTYNNLSLPTSMFSHAAFCVYAYVCIKELLSSHFTRAKEGMKNHTLKIC